MTGIDRYISELLFDHDCVILPGFGGFLTNYSGARIHPIKHSFHPPARTIVFNANLSTNDGLLIEYVSRVINISYQEASGMVNDYASSCIRDLEAGNTIHFTNIGTCRMGREKNIIFDPDHSSNYLADAFGLPSFVSPAIKRESVRERLEKQLTPHPVPPSEKKKRNLRPALGWAAGISIPIAAALLLYMYSPRIVDDLGRSYASFVPTVKFTSGESRLPASAGSDARFENFRLMPEETPKENAVVPEQLPQPKPEAVTVNTLKKYQIVVGAFSREANAKKYVYKLQTKSYDASIIGNSSTGLIRVSINGSDSKRDAIQLLEQVRSDENPSAWLLRIK
ncbi:MAG: SPOR domain-containing protein [Bacteroidota bacterium]